MVGNVGNWQVASEEHGIVTTESSQNVPFEHLESYDKLTAPVSMSQLKYCVLLKNGIEDR